MPRKDSGVKAARAAVRRAAERVTDGHPLGKVRVASRGTKVLVIADQNYDTLVMDDQPVGAVQLPLL